jgi:hypothetical protein
MIGTLSLRSLTVAMSILVFVTGCVFEAGPAYLRIQTDGKRYDDFVIEPIQEYGRIHSSEMIVMDALIVASEEELTLPKFSAGWTFSSLLVSAYHPEFVYAWTGKADSSSDELLLSPLRPRRWADYREEYGEVSMQVVAGHLDNLLRSYVPTFEAGESRKRLQRYLPGLGELVKSASWLSGDSRGWATEAEARADLQDKLQALSELMQ